MNSKDGKNLKGGRRFSNRMIGIAVDTLLAFSSHNKTSSSVICSASSERFNSLLVLISLLRQIYVIASFVR
jgi:hypothetical protein